MGQQAPWSGSRACAACHAEIYQRYTQTAMANSGGLAGSSGSPERFDHAAFKDAAGTHRYSISSGGGNYTLEMRGPGGSSSVAVQKLKYFIGSGTAARSYLLDFEGFLYEAPVTYYSRTGKWSFSPGYEKYSYPFLARAITPPCLQCHVSGIQAIPDTQNGYQSRPFLEGGVSCERCHGPGAAHVRSGAARDIVNPASLAPEERESVCAQCHLGGEIRIDRTEAGFIAGKRLSDYTVAFVRQTSSPNIKVTSHVENLAQSTCSRMSGERLWCGSCHDPHGPPAPAARVEWFRSKCLACHAASACKGEAASRAATGNDCTACHMPRQPATDAAHVVATDHSIPRRPNQRRSAAVSPDAPLIPFGQTTASARELGLAYAIVALREQNAIYRERAFELLKEAQRVHPSDPQTLSYLADLYKTRGNDKDGESLYRILLPLHPAQASAPASLGAYAMERGRVEEAIRLWHQALQISPSLPLVRVNLAAALLRTGRPDEARAVLKKALEFNPEFPAALKLLEQIH